MRKGIRHKTETKKRRVIVINALRWAIANHAGVKAEILAWVSQSAGSC
ncbi:hypothetical protein SBA7_1430007 [Candidatus Sulfotelmatobacter sp. SbA7]|nr:hypothetical protein SBA7_1430007 [Candidatus Sulfotelmatobacter sp. SbA7]